MNRIALFLLLSLLMVTRPLLGQSTLPFSWVEGKWEVKNKNSTMMESWKRLNDSTLVGRSVMIKNGADTTLLETLQISYQHENWCYSSTVKGQNNNTAVIFKVAFLKGEEFIVENPEHDFPTRIAYRRVGNNLYASIEGRKGSKIDKRNFDYIKVD